MTAPAGPVLSTEQLAARWGVKRSSIDRKRREGTIPAPFNAGWGHSFRWHLDVIEAYEQQAVAV